jgi:single-stranded DNA-binding protein
MNIVVLRGSLSSAPQHRDLPSGSVVWTLEVTTSTPSGNLSVPVALFDPPAPPEFVPGDAVVVVGEVRRRFFRTGAATQSRTEVVAAEVVGARPAARARKVVERALRHCADSP